MVIGMTRTNLAASGLPYKLWFYALQYSVFIINRTPRSAIDFKTPYFMRYGSNFNIDNLHPFGTHCIIYNEKANKLQPRGTPARWIGVSDTMKGHIIWTGTRVCHERNVQFVDPPSHIEGERTDTLPL